MSESLSIGMKVLFWRRVTNAREFLDVTVKTVVDGENILLSDAYSIPWRSTYREIAQNDIHERIGTSDLINIDGDKEEDPGPYLLKSCCKPEVRLQYRPSVPISKFLADNDDTVLHSRIYWVQIHSQEQLDAWEDFASSYLSDQKRREKEHAVFIIACTLPLKIHKKRAIREFSYSSCLTSYDNIVFTTAAAGALKHEPSLGKPYLTELAVSVCDGDLELIAKCLSDAENFIRDPWGVICKIQDTEKREDGTDFAENLTKDEMEHRIWQAQIRTVFPILEDYRRAFIHKHEVAIASCLGGIDPPKNSAGEILRDPLDVELGTMVYFVGTHKLQVSPEEYEKLDLARQCRNDLSHITPMSYKKQKKLQDLLHQWQW